MALLNVVTATSPGVDAGAPAQITAWAAGDTISGSEIGERGVIAEVTNTSGGSIDFRVSDPGFTPAGNQAANGYTTVPVPTAVSMRVLITQKNVNPTTGVAKVGSGSAAVSTFTVRVIRY